MSTNDQDVELAPTSTTTAGDTAGSADPDADKAAETTALSVGSIDSVAAAETDTNSWLQFRKFVRLEIITAPWFEPVILMVIVVNCVFLALDNPTRSNQTLKDVVYISEIVFTVIYLFEMLLKFIGLGFFGRHKVEETASQKTKEQKTSVFAYMVNTVFKGDERRPPKDEYVGYFLDGWNVLDFFIVMVGSVIPLAFPVSSVSSIRALRILRALRTIPRIPKLRTLVLTILNAIPGLTGSVVLLSFFFIIFGIIGVQVFNGQLQSQCVDTHGKVLTYIELDYTYTAICNPDRDGSESIWFSHRWGSCNDVAVAVGYLPNYTCQQDQENPNYGMQNYDNIFHSLLQVFQIVTLQDWTHQVYDLARGHSYAVNFFFIPITFIVSFFAINLILAVIVHTYGYSLTTVITAEDYDNTLHEVDDLIEKKSSKRSAPVKQQITYETYPRKLRSLREKVKTFEALFKEYNQGPVERAVKKHELQRKTKLRVETQRGGNDDEKHSMHMELAAIAEEMNGAQSGMLSADMMDEEEFKGETWEFTRRADEQKKLRREMIEDMMLNFNKDLAYEVWLLAKPIKDEWLTGKPMVVKWLHWVSTSEWFEKAIIFIIMINTIILAIHWPQMPEDVLEALDVLNICFTVLFAFEMVIKMVGLGPRRWWFDKFNVFDAVIVLVSLIELAIPGDTAAGALLAFRALRVLRVLRLLHQIPGLRILLTSIMDAFEPVFFLICIFVLFIFMFGVLGVQMFAGKIMDLKTNEFLEMTRPWRFDNLWYSMVTTLQLFSANGWPQVMGDAVEATSPAAALLFVVVVVLGLWLFKNMFLAILINRMNNQDNVQLLIDDLLTSAKQKQHAFDEKTAIKEFEKDVKKVRKMRMGSKKSSTHQKRIEKIEAKKQITGKSLGFLVPTNGFRLKLHALVSSEWFEWTINILILTNCVFLAMNNPHVPRHGELGSILYILDWVFTFVFLVEMVLKMMALGIWTSKVKEEKSKDGDDDNKPRRKKEIDPADMPCTNAYLSTWWNRLDGFVVLCALFGLGFPDVSFLRGLRAIRPIRVAIRIPQVRVVVKALIHSATNVMNAFFFSFFILFVFSIIGLQSFSGQLGRCTHTGQAFDLVPIDVASSESECKDAGKEWINPGYNFDNIAISMLSVFKISMFNSWYDELASGMASAGNSQADDPKAANPFGRPVAAIFFVGVVMIAGFFVLNIIISVVVDSFNRIKKEGEANALLTQKQVLWVRKRRFLQRFPIREAEKRPRAGWRLGVYDFVERPAFEYFIIGCILLNTLFLMTEHYGQPQSWTDALFAFEIIFVTIYSLEAILKLVAWGPKQYFEDWWNVFDFVIVIISIVAMPLDNGLAVIRLLRVLRVIRLVKKAPLLRALFVTLGYAIPSIFNIGLLLLVIFFIFGIFGVELFGRVVHSDGYGNPIMYDSNGGISNSINFEYFGNALFILYRTATNDNWGSILLAAGAEGSYCPNSILTMSYDDVFEYECGSMAASVLFFVLFSIFGTFVMINLFVAVILETYVDNVEFEQKLITLDLLNEWVSMWKDEERKAHGEKIRGRLPVKTFVNTLKQSPVLIGMLLHSLNLRLNIEDSDAAVDYDDTKELKRRSTESYGKVDFVGKPNPADTDVVVTYDHINAVMKTRRLRILCKYHGRGGLDEILIVTYSDALFSIASLLVGPEHRLLPYDNNRQVHISDWWAERLEDILGAPVEAQYDF